MVRDAVKNYLALAGGVTEVTRQRALAAAKSLVASGEATAEQVSGIAEELLATSRGNRDALSALVKVEIDRALSRLGLATAEEVGALTARVQRLEAATRERPPARPAKASPAKASPAKASPAKRAAGPSGT